MSDELYERVRRLPSGYLINDEATKRWINGLPKSFIKKNGKPRYGTYLPALDEFLQWLNEELNEEVSPSRLLEMRFSQLQSNDIRKRRWIEEAFQRYWKTALETRCVKSGAREGKLVSDSMKLASKTAIGSFFKHNYAPLTKLNVGRKKPRRVTQDYWFKLSDIQAMRAVGMPWERAYLTTDLSLGLRRGDATWLEWSDLWPYVVNTKVGEVVGPLLVFTEKYGVEARPFLSPDSIVDLKFLRIYQNEQERLGRYVFASPSGKPYHEDHINARLKILFQRAGLDNLGLMVRTHGLRKMLFNELKNVGCPVDVRKMIIGKAVDADVEAYVSDDELKKWFLLVLPRISLMEPSLETTSKLKEKIQSLEEKYESLRSMVLTRLTDLK